MSSVIAPTDNEGSVNLGRSLDSVPHLSVFNVKAYGAQADGVFDDGPAIQAAIDAAFAVNGGVVYFPQPTPNYRVGESLVIKSKVHLHGSGRNCRVIGAPGIDILTMQGSVSQLVIRDLYLTAAAPGGRCINFSGGTFSQSFIRHCIFQATDGPTCQAIYGYGSFVDWGLIEVTFENCWLWGENQPHTKPVVELGQTDGGNCNLVTFRDCRIHGAVGDTAPIVHLYSEGPNYLYGILFDRCNFEVPVHGCILAEGTHGLTIRDCQAWDFAEATASMIHLGRNNPLAISCRDTYIQSFYTAGSGVDNSAFYDIDLDVSSETTIIGSGGHLRTNGKINCANRFAHIIAPMATTIDNADNALIFDAPAGLMTVPNTFLPTVDDTYYLGSAAQRWRGGYFGSAIEIHENAVPLSVTDVFVGSTVGGFREDVAKLSVYRDASVGQGWVFSVTNYDGDTSEAMRIDTTSLIGIGTPTPDSMLEIESNQVTRPNLKLKMIAAQTAPYLRCVNENDAVISELPADGAASFATGAFDVTKDGTLTIAGNVLYVNVAHESIGIGTGSNAVLDAANDRKVVLIDAVEAATSIPANGCAMYSAGGRPTFHTGSQDLITLYKQAAIADANATINDLQAKLNTVLQYLRNLGLVSPT